MNEIRKLIEAVEQLNDGQDHSALNAREYKAFVYGVEWGNSAQYNDGGYSPKDLPEAYNEWVENGRKPSYYGESLEEADKDEFKSKLEGSFEDKLRKAFKAGWQEGYREGEGAGQSFGVRSDSGDSDSDFDYWLKYEAKDDGVI